MGKYDKKVTNQAKDTIKYYENINNLEEIPIDILRIMYKNKINKLNEKDKIIEEMAEKLNQAYFDEDKFCIWFEKMMGVQQKMDYGYVVDLIKQYFENKAKE